MLTAIARLPALALLLGIAATSVNTSAAAEAAPPAAAEVAPDAVIARPLVRVGDAWSYRQTSLITGKSARFDYRVVEAAAGRIRTISEGYGESYTADWNLVESSAGIRIAPHEGYFDFPLAPGKSYPFKAQRTVAKTRVAWEGSVLVRGWETIDVPAGRFRALRVDVTGSFGNGPASKRAQLRQSYWWTDEVRRWVRHDLWMSGPAGRATALQARTELIRFTSAQ
jgi:hypothetical protein